jgi:NAD(P)-dependent dehydrogenase (short-subunit alcohol dehydrogenase family)
VHAPVASIAEMDIADQAAGGYVDTDIVEQVPMGRFAATDDVAAAIAFLADPASSGFVNGVTLPVDGGWTADLSWTQAASAQTLT